MKDQDYILDAANLDYTLGVERSLPNSLRTVLLKFIQGVNLRICSEKDLCLLRDSKFQHRFQFIRVEEYFSLIEVSLSSVEDLAIQAKQDTHICLPFTSSLAFSMVLCLVWGRTI